MVDARQCAHAETVATDTGFVNVASGEWVIRGESGECYVVDDIFFRRTFREMPEQVQAGARERSKITAFRLSLRRRIHPHRVARMA